MEDKLNKLKKILLIQTGGTLAMVEKNGVLTPASNTEMIRHVPDLRKIAEINVIDLFNIDSSNVQFHHWEKIAEVIFQNSGQYDGFVIIHGTDTMVYTASALSFMLNNLSKPVVITGSQKPLASILSDAKSNLLYAVHMATLDIPEVTIYFDYQLFRGNRTVKASSTEFAAFDSPNFPALVKIGVETKINKTLIRKPSGIFQTLKGFDDRVMVLRLFPGMQIDHLKLLCNRDIKGFIVQAFGMGNVPAIEKSLIPFIEEADKNNSIVAIASQSPRGKIDLTRYESSNHALEAGAISCRDMTIETAIIKMMFLLYQFKDIKMVKSNFQQSIAGELES